MTKINETFLTKPKTEQAWITTTKTHITEICARRQRMIAKREEGDRNLRKPDEFRKKKDINNWWADLNVIGKKTFKQSNGRWNSCSKNFKWATEKKNRISCFCFATQNHLSRVIVDFLFDFCFRNDWQSARRTKARSKWARNWYAAFNQATNTCNQQKRKTMMFKFVHLPLFGVAMFFNGLRT